MTAAPRRKQLCLFRRFLASSMAAGALTTVGDDDAISDRWIISVFIRNIASRMESHSVSAAIWPAPLCYYLHWMSALMRASLNIYEARLTTKCHISEIPQRSSRRSRRFHRWWRWYYLYLNLFNSTIRANADDASNTSVDLVSLAPKRFINELSVNLALFYAAREPLFRALIIPVVRLLT